MTKADLVEILAGAASGSKSDAARALSAFLEGIRDGLLDDGAVTISGFGTFVVTRRASRAGRDPRSGRTITIPSARVPRFRACRALKAAIR